MHEPNIQPDSLVQELKAFIEASVKRFGSTDLIKPNHRVAFHWPPPSVSGAFHVLASDWTEAAEFTTHGETFEVKVARNAFGVFGRCEKFWNEARGASLEEMLRALKKSTEPLLERQRIIAETLGVEGRWEMPIKTLAPTDLIKLLYCPDRDVAKEAQTCIETHASSGLFTAALIEILLDDQHPHRRSAQWCVCDMFEDLPAFARTDECQKRAINAIKMLIWNASDDYARTIYKAGVVLGGHICTNDAADALIACIFAPHPVARRSAQHAVFHLAEWLPERKGDIVEALIKASKEETNPLLKLFSASMAQDIEAGCTDHVTEPVFPEEEAC